RTGGLGPPGRSVATDLDRYESSDRDHEARGPRFMTENRPGYLTPVPAAPGRAPNRAAVAAQVEEAAPPEATPGRTPARERGHSGMFITDVIVDLGFATKERVEEAVNEARMSGQTPETVLIEQNVVDEDQLSRAIAERYGLDHVDLTVYKVDMG